MMMTPWRMSISHGKGNDGLMCYVRVYRDIVMVSRDVLGIIACVGGGREDVRWRGGCEVDGWEPYA